MLVWIEFAYLIRFQLIAALSLSVVLPACVFLFPSLFIGIFDALGFRSLVFVVAASLQLAWTVMITSRLVLVYGPTRFPGIAPLRGKPNPPWSTTGLFAGLAAPCIVNLGRATLHVLFFRHFDFWKLKGTRGESHPGLLTHDGRLHSGHQLAATALTMSIALYAVVGIYFSPTAQNMQPASELSLQSLETSSAILVARNLLFGMGASEHPAAALFYLLYLLAILTWLFSGLAFVFDKARLPVIIVSSLPSPSSSSSSSSSGPCRRRISAVTDRPEGSESGHSGCILPMSIETIFLSYTLPTGLFLLTGFRSSTRTLWNPPKPCRITRICSCPKKNIAVAVTF